MNRRALLRALAWVAVCAAAGLAEEPLHLRLNTPLSSYGSRPGTEFRATVIEPWMRDGVVRIPARASVHGVVRRARRVGIGLVHERALLDLTFDAYTLPDGRTYAFRGTLFGLENARERVDAKGTIRGILAADNPHGLVHGMWRRPSALLLSRSAAGLTGTSGRIWTGFALGPVGALGLFAARLALLPMPEPEIQLPAEATELRVEVDALPKDAPVFAPEPAAPIPIELALDLSGLPYAVEKSKGEEAADIINIAFLGSERELQNAFKNAGWVLAEPRSRGSFVRAYRAFGNQRGYSSAPVSRLSYRNEEPAFVYQKSFNTVAKRHHIRIWPGAVAYGGRTLWVGAATHDTGVEFNLRNFTTSHRIDRHIDRERAKVVADLEYAGCAAEPRYLERSRVRVSTAAVITDGRLAVLELQSCTARVSSASALPPPGNTASRLVRRVSLETRQYLLRGNIYRWGYRALRTMFGPRGVQDTCPEEDPVVEEEVAR